MGSERGVCWGVSGDPHSLRGGEKDVRVCLRKRGVSARGGGACATTMKLDPSALRYLSKDDFRVLTAVELGQRNHEIVPTVLVERIANLGCVRASAQGRNAHAKRTSKEGADVQRRDNRTVRRTEPNRRGDAYKVAKNLLRHKLVHHERKKYDGYRLTTLGYDYLAIQALVKKGLISGVGTQIGVGKESDIFEATDEQGRAMVLKLHRLGRTSFRAVKNKRDYLEHRKNFSWLYLSRLAAKKEFAFMRALGEHGFPVPEAIEVNRHCVLMERMAAYPLVRVRNLGNVQDVYRQAVGLVARLAQHGLIHCDFNEFNLMITEREELIVIDFPQMVSTSHPNAKMFYERDMRCIVDWFHKQYRYDDVDDVESYLSFETVVGQSAAGLLDKELRASGYDKECEDTLEDWRKASHGDSGSSEEEEELSNDEEEEPPELERATQDVTKLEVG